MARKPKSPKQVKTIDHAANSRRNLPSAAHQTLMDDDERKPIRVAIERRSRDLDPQLVWSGKDETALAVSAPPLYIQERVSPKALVDDLMRVSARPPAPGERQPEFADLFADFDGLPSPNARTEFYQHDANWSNRMILGDSLQVMASLAEREGMRGKVQCIYIDPPYGIKFNSNFQWSTTSRTVKDGRIAHITREPEQVKAFRDTWNNGIQSYLSYLRDRLTIARDLLAESGSVFVQIGEENVHRVRVLMDEVFGDENFVSLITVRTSSGTTQQGAIKRISDYIVWYSRNAESIKFRRLLVRKPVNTKMYNQMELSNGVRRPMTTAEKRDVTLLPKNSRPYQKLPMFSKNSGNHESRKLFGSVWSIPPMRSWRYAPDGFQRLYKANRIHPDKTALRTIYYHDDYTAYEINNSWDDTGPEQNKIYVVQTSITPIQRCILMTTDPGDLVLDPTCGSGATAHVAEQWGRRWITIDTSRVALALARARIMGARYPYYLLSDSREGQLKEAKIELREPYDEPTSDDVRQGFVYERVPHIKLGDIAKNAEIDAIHEEFQRELEPLRAKLNAALGESWKEWEIPRELPPASPAAKRLHARWWRHRIARQKKIDASITAKADYETLFDKPYKDKGKVRVAGPFTVESVSPHRMLDVDQNGKFVDHVAQARGDYDFGATMLEELEQSGVQQSRKEDRISFESITPLAGGELICAEARLAYSDDAPGRAAIFIGPEFGTVSRADLVGAAIEAAERGFDMLIACAFAFDAHTTEFETLGRVRVLKARMNADLHMSADLKNTGKGNLFVVFGEPDVTVERGRWLLTRGGRAVTRFDAAREASGVDSLREMNAAPARTRAAIDSLADADFPLKLSDGDWLQATVNGVDVYHPNTGEVRSDDADGIACWFVDTDYDSEAFFVRQAYFLGAGDPYKRLKTTLKAEIDKEAWATLNSAVSRPFPRPDRGRIAVKIINHLGDEVMKTIAV